MDLRSEIRFFTALRSDLEARGVPADRAAGWARAQVSWARKAERQGRRFAYLAACGFEAAERIAGLDAAGCAPRAWN